MMNSTERLNGMTDFEWSYESDFVNIDLDKESDEPMLNLYFNFPTSIQLTKEQALQLQKGLKTVLDSIRPQKSDNLEEKSL